MAGAVGLDLERTRAPSGAVESGPVRSAPTDALVALGVGAVSLAV